MSRAGKAPPREAAPLITDRDRHCATCRCWQERDKGQGECRRYPKQTIVTASGALAHTFPLTMAGDFCEEYRSR